MTLWSATLLLLVVLVPICGAMAAAAAAATTTAVAAAAAGAVYVGPLPCTDASCPAGANNTNFHIRDVSVGPGGDGYYCASRSTFLLWPTGC